MQVKKQQLEPDMEQWTGNSGLGKEYDTAVFVTCLFNLYAEYIMQNAEMDESQAVMLILPGEISATSDTQMILL